MADRKLPAIIDIGKILFGTGATTAAAVFGVLGNPLLAGLAGFASVAVPTYEGVRSRIKQLNISDGQEVNIEIPVPDWWQSDDAAWQGFCMEFCQYLPRVSRHSKDQRVKKWNTSLGTLAFLISDAHPPNWRETLIEDFSQGNIKFSHIE